MGRVTSVLLSMMLLVCGIRATALKRSFPRRNAGAATALKNINRSVNTATKERVCEPGKTPALKRMFNVGFSPGALKRSFPRMNAGAATALKNI